MKTLRLAHTYIACIFAPLTVFFIVSGSLQTWDLHRGRKDNSYTPPSIVFKLCHIHTKQSLPPDDPAHKLRVWPFRVVGTLLSLGMLSTIALGLVMAFRFTTKKRRIMILLILGSFVPSIIVLMQH